VRPLVRCAVERGQEPHGADAPEDVHAHELVDLDEPTDRLTRQERDSVSGDEGREIRMMAFLKMVKTERSGESCNCNLHSLPIVARTTEGAGCGRKTKSMSTRDA
jgi:hypothetical protein